MNEHARTRNTARSGVARDAIRAHAEQCGKDIVTALERLDITVGLGCICVTEMVRIGLRPLNGVTFRDVLRLRHDISSRFEDDLRLYSTPKGLFAEWVCSTDRTSAELERAKKSRARPKCSFTPSNVVVRSRREACPYRLHTVKTMQRLAGSVIVKLTATLSEFGIDVLPLTADLCTLYRFTLEPCEGLRMRTILRCNHELSFVTGLQALIYASAQGAVFEMRESSDAYTIVSEEKLHTCSRQQTL